MADYYIGDGATNGGSDPNSGSLLIALPVVVDASWDQGEFGFPFPANARIYPTLVVTGGGPGAPHPLPASFPLTGEIPTPVLIFGTGGAGGAEGFTLQVKITDPLIATPIGVLGGTGLNILLQETVVFAVQVLGDFPVFTVEPLTREYFAENDPEGVRPSSPWQISRTVKHHAEVVLDGVFQMAVNTPFLVDSALTAATDPILWGLGARPNYIGMVVEETRPDSSTATLARFRAPELYEVIIVDPCDVYRWNGTAWVAYETQPQRNLSGQLIFDLLDPDGIYDYFAKLVGVCMAQWQYDTEHLRVLVEPRDAPDDFVSLLGDNFGLVGDTDDEVQKRRTFIRQFVQLQRQKGSPQSIVDALTILGYTGYAKHVWVIPGGTSTDYIERPLGYDVVTPAGPYHPASQVSIHLNDANGDPLIIDDGIRQRVGDFLMRFVLPAHVRVRTFATDVPVKATPEGAGVSDSLTITDV